MRFKIGLVVVSVEPPVLFLPSWTLLSMIILGPANELYHWHLQQQSTETEDSITLDQAIIMTEHWGTFLLPI